MSRLASAALLALVCASSSAFGTVLPPTRFAVIDDVAVQSYEKSQPKNVSIVDWTNPVRDQGVLGSCQSFSFIGMVENQVFVTQRITLDLSERFQLFANYMTFSDMGGSLRNPASFCGIVGLRPSIGRVAHTVVAAVDRNLGVQGPMARNVEDVALLLDAMSGEHPGDPLSLPVLPNSFLSAARSGSKPKRVAYSPDLGITPVDPEVKAVTRKAAQRFAEAGAIVEEAHPDLREAHECFHVLRAFDFALSKAALLRSRRDLLKPEVIWNIEEGLKLTVEQLERAEAQRVAMTARTLEFFDKYDLLLCPATIVPPFPVENRYVAECDGRKFDNYVEWLGIVYAITLVCCPALSMPCGFTASGLPIGLQVVAPPRGEAQLLAGAKVLEDILGLRDTTPIDPRAPK